MKFLMFTKLKYLQIKIVLALKHSDVAFIPPVNVKMPTNVGILTFTGGINFIVSKGAKIRNQYNQVRHPTQDTNGKVTSSQLDTTNESQEVSPFPAGDHKAQLNRRAQGHSKHKTEQKHKRSTKETNKFHAQLS